MPGTAATGPADALAHRAKFVETMLLGGHNALTDESWRGASQLRLRLASERGMGLSDAVAGQVKAKLYVERL